MENVDKIKRGEPVANPDKIVKATHGRRRVRLSLPPRLRGGQGGVLACSLDRAADPTRRRFARPPFPKSGRKWQYMRTDLFDFDLPADRIALRPASPRDAARLLVVRPGAAAELRRPHIRDLPDLLRPGDYLVVNDTKVIAARLTAGASGAGDRRQDRGDPASSGSTARTGRPVKPGASKAPGGDTLRFGERGQGLFPRRTRCQVRGERRRRRGNAFDFAFHGPVLDQAIAERGAMPLPPYIASRRARRRPATAPTTRPCLPAPRARWRRRPPACISPNGLLAALAARGIALHTRDAACRRRHLPAGEGRGYRRAPMHAEWGEVSRRDRCGAQCGARRGRPHRRGRHDRRCGCWKARRAPKMAQLRAFAGETAIFITPGYRFRAVDLLLTNFHLPRSTLFMLVAAFCGLDAMQARLRPRDRRAAIASIPMAMPACYFRAWPMSDRLLASHRRNRRRGAHAA